MHFELLSPRRLTHGSLFKVLFLTGCVHYQDKPLSPDTTVTAFEQRSLDDEALHQFLQRNVGASVIAWPMHEWSFETLSWVSFYYHPSLELARAQWSSIEAGKTTAAARPNPTINVTGGYNFSADDVSPWFPSINIDLPVETAGKRHYRIEQSQHAAEASRQTLFVAAWQVRSDLHRALVTWIYERRRYEVQRSQIEIEQRIMELTEGRRRAGAASTLETSTTRLAWIRAEADAANKQRQISLALQDVAQALGVPASALEKITISETPGIPPLPSDAAFVAARSFALRNRADLLSALADYAATQSALRLEVARQYPDVHLGPGYQWDQGANKWSLGVTFELPAFNRNAGPIAEAEARRTESAARFKALQIQITTAIDRAHVAFEAARVQTYTTRELTQENERELGIQKARLQVGDIDPLEYQVARRELTLAQLSAIDAEAAYALAAVDLEAALQIPFQQLTSLAETTLSKASSP